TTEIYTLSLHDALPISRAASITNTSISDNLANSGTWKSLSGIWGNSQDKVIWAKMCLATGPMTVTVTGASGTIRIAAVEYSGARSEEHTSELQSLAYLV